MDLIYPEHKHPHGIDNTKPNKYRIWVCDEGGHIFLDNEIREDITNGCCGHTCKEHPYRKGQRCESHLKSYLPEVEGESL